MNFEGHFIFNDYTFGIIFATFSHNCLLSQSLVLDWSGSLLTMENLRNTLRSKGTFYH